MVYVETVGQGVRPLLPPRGEPSDWLNLAVGERIQNFSLLNEVEVLKPTIYINPSLI